MVDVPQEAGLFAGVAGAVLIKLGTPYDATRAPMLQAARGAADAGTPWVLDPVAVGALCSVPGLLPASCELRRRSGR